MPRKAQPTLHIQLKDLHEKPRSFASRPLDEGETRIGRDYSMEGAIHVPFVHIKPIHLKESGLTPAQVHMGDTLQKHGIPLDGYHFDGSEPYRALSRHIGTFGRSDDGLRYRHVSEKPGSAVRYSNGTGSIELKPGGEVYLDHGDMLEFGPLHQSPLATVQVDLRGNGPEMMMTPFRAGNYMGKTFTTESGKSYAIDPRGILAAKSSLNGKGAIYVAGFDPDKSHSGHKEVVRTVRDRKDPEAIKELLIPHVLQFGKPPAVGKQLLLVTSGGGVKLTSPITRIE